MTHDASNVPYIDRRSFLTLFGTAAGLPAGAAAGAPPNVIMMMADDLGWGDTGFNGNRVIRTPHLDEMARAGIRFQNFHSGGPVCSPTRGTCLTGRHYFRYGIFNSNRGHLPAQEITIARLLKTRGYATGHFGKWHLGTLDKNASSKGQRRLAAVNYAPPWERDYDESFVTESRVPTWNPQSMGYGEHTPYYHNGRRVTEALEGDDSRILMDRAIPFIRAAAQRRQPFLAVIWFHAPHEPTLAGPEYRSLYSRYSEDEQHYYGCVTAMDEQVGRLRRELRSLGVDRNTMLWFCSDNGPEGFTGTEERMRGSTGGLRGRKRSLFQGGVTVPGLLEWPGHAKAGRVEELPCSTLDYLPTIMEATGSAMPGRPRPLDGISLMPLIKGRMKQRPSPLCYRAMFPKAAMHDSPTLATVEGRYKLLTNLSEDGSEDLLFDVVSDREEKKNILPAHRDLALDMKRRLREWIESCRASHSGADYDEPFTPVEPFPVLTGDWPSGKVPKRRSR